jgi:hypothetical protein
MVSTCYAVFGGNAGVSALPVAASAACCGCEPTATLVPSPRLGVQHSVLVDVL